MMLLSTATSASCQGAHSAGSNLLVSLALRTHAHSWEVQFAGAAFQSSLVNVRSTACVPGLSLPPVKRDIPT